VTSQGCIKNALLSLGLDPAQYKSSTLLYTISKARSRALEDEGPGSRVLSAHHFKSALQTGAGWKVIPEGYAEGLVHIHREYCSILERARALDFDMLLLLTIWLLEDHPGVLNGELLL